MATSLDLADIQGNITREYGRFGFPYTRYLFLRINDCNAGRAFVGAVTEKVTTSITWGDGPDTPRKPAVVINIALSYRGLEVLGLPYASLMSFPDEFIMGMQSRKDILGDDGPSDPQHWDPIWRNPVHVLIVIHGNQCTDIEGHYAWINRLISQSAGGVELLIGHRGDTGICNLPYQDAQMIFENGKPTNKEHFGYVSGISNPVFEGLSDGRQVLGRGKLTRDGKWMPLATGEFILGHLDEAMEYPSAPKPMLLARNGTFMVYRKLHENVGSFSAFIEKQSRGFVGGKELLAAKLMGRWPDNGAPLVSAPDEQSKQKWDAQFVKANRVQRDMMLNDFTYSGDPYGVRCPFSSHIRRINPRDSLKPASGAYDTPGALVNRHRILRRGSPYGEVKDRSRDDGNQGIIMMMLNASIKRQFEFVQQQWINHGDDFNQGSDKDVLLGNHDPQNPGKVVIPVDPNSDQPPHFVKDIPRLVETRGGEYFFVPSLTALRMISRGIVDPA